MCGIWLKVFFGDQKQNRLNKLLFNTTPIFRLKKKCFGWLKSGCGTLNSKVTRALVRTPNGGPQWKTLLAVVKRCRSKISFYGLKFKLKTIWFHWRTKSRNTSRYVHKNISKRFNSFSLLCHLLEFYESRICDNTCSCNWRSCSRHVTNDVSPGYI